MTMCIPPNSRTRVVHAACAVALGWGALAPLNGWASPSAEETQACRATVLKFEETVAFIRQSQGNPAATAMREKLLPAKLETDLLMNSGYCGIARYLRDKKLVS